MFRRIGIIAAVGVIVGSVAGFAAPAGAAPAVTATGQIECQVDGKVSFSPKLVTGGTTPTVVRYHGTTGYCFSGPEFVDPAAADITGAKFSGSFTLPTNDCGDAGGVDGVANEFAVKWKATGHRVVKSTVALPSATMLFLSVSIDYPVLVSQSSSLTTGSFAGDDGSVHLSMYSLKSNAATMCRPKEKGVPHTGGMKQLEFGGGDSYIALEDL
jgi:hypothetical protein